MIIKLTLDSSLVADHGIPCDILMDMYGTLLIHHSLHTLHRLTHALSLPAQILPAKKISYKDKQGKFQNLCHFYRGMGLKLGVFLFSFNQNNLGVSCASVTCIYCSLSVKINMCKTETLQLTTFTDISLI